MRKKVFYLTSKKIGKIMSCWCYISEIRVWYIYGTILRGRNRSSSSNWVFFSVQVPFRLPQGLTWDRTQVSAMRGWWLTIWAMAQPWMKVSGQGKFQPLENLTGAWVDPRVRLEVIEKRRS